jgi:hypothetical protein
LRVIAVRLDLGDELRWLVAATIDDAQKAHPAELAVD